MQSCWRNRAYRDDQQPTITNRWLNQPSTSAPRKHHHTSITPDGHETEHARYRFLDFAGIIEVRQARPPGGGIPKGHDVACGGAV